MKKIFFEDRAQAGAVFRLLVDSIIMLAVLVIILSTLAYFDNMRVAISNKEFQDIIRYAVDSKSGEIIASKDLFFPQGRGYSNYDLGAFTGYPEECFTLDSSLAAVKVYGNKEGIEFTRPVQTRVYAGCVVNGGESFCDTGCWENINPGEVCEVPCCEICCLVSFGRDITENDIPPSCSTN